MVLPSLFVVIIVAFPFGGFLFGLLFELSGVRDLIVASLSEIVKQRRARPWSKRRLWANGVRLQTEVPSRHPVQAVR
jgi:hypothetical protein